MSKKLRNFLELYLTKKIGAEIKCCLIWLYLVCYYCVCRLICGFTEADIIHLLEMLFAAYFVQWVQVLLRSDFDEVDRLSVKEYVFIAVSSAVFAVLGMLPGWFDGKIGVTAGFFVFMICAYLCTFLVYKTKRAIDARLLNNNLKRFQERSKK